MSQASDAQHDHNLFDCQGCIHDSFRDELQTADLAKWKAVAAELDGALEKAKDTIRAWHGMGPPVSPEAEAHMWDLYQASPEMRMISAALRAYRELKEAGDVQV